MTLKRDLLSFLYIPYQAINFSKSILFSNGNDTRVRILLFHDIPRNQHREFCKKLDYLSKKWNFITAQEFTNFLDGNNILKGDNLLLTFDDGFHSNIITAKEILNPMGIKALFFVVSELVELTNQKDQIKFIRQQLFPSWINNKIPKHIDQMKSLTYEDLNYLYKEGHTIGFHTATHTDLSKISDKKILFYEIIDSANNLEKKLGIVIKHFSFSFGHVSFFSKEALKIAKSRFPYIYTGMRGDNAKSKIPWAIRRDHIEINDSLYLMNSFLGGIADFKYKKDFITYENWSK